MLAGTMALLAMRTDTPELMVTQDEEAAFLMRVQNVMRHYGTKTNQKALDWAALVGTTANLAWPRAVAIHQRRKAERGDTGERGQVLHFRPRARPAEAQPGDTGQAEPHVYQPAIPPEVDPDAGGF